ncbi:MAG: nitroreductase/quinone reductase family protein [Nostocoides sp.]
MRVVTGVHAAVFDATRGRVLGSLVGRPVVKLTTTGRRHQRRMAARTATRDERALLWPRVVATYKGYAAYQARTDREIPLVLCE